jgi:hypothetical protein
LGVPLQELLHHVGHVAAYKLLWNSHGGAWWTSIDPRMYFLLQVTGAFAEQFELGAC